MKRRVFISVFAGAAALALATITPAVAQGTFDPPGLNRAIAIQEANTDGLLEIQGVVGTGVGVDARGQAAVIIMTEDVGVRGLPRRLNGVSVVVKVTGKFRAGHHREGHGGGGDSGGDTAIDPDRPVRASRSDRCFDRKQHVVIGGNDRSPGHGRDRCVCTEQQPRLRLGEQCGYG